jgi:hypothetical protein
MKVKREMVNMSSTYPSWPIELMQALAKYTFENGGLLDYGDHVPNVLDEHGTRVKHLLLCKDAQFCTDDSNYFKTTHGKVKFIQVKLN